jgi:hypothetical protein
LSGLLTALSARASVELFQISPTNISDSPITVQVTNVDSDERFTVFYKTNETTSDKFLHAQLEISDWKNKVSSTPIEKTWTTNGVKFEFTVSVAYLATSKFTVSEQGHVGEMGMPGFANWWFYLWDFVAKQSVDLDRLRGNSDGYYWYFKLWLSNYLDEHHIQTDWTNIVHIIAGSSSPQSADTNSLRVVVIPSKTEVRIKEKFNVALRVENPTTTSQTVRVESCTWHGEWKTSNTNISWIPEICTVNFGAINVEIPPGGAYTNELEMFIPEPISEKTLSFRMGFTPIDSKKTFWSDEVKLNVK